MVRKRPHLRAWLLALGCLAGGALGPWAPSPAAQGVATPQSQIDVAQQQAQALASRIESNEAALAQAQTRARAAAAREARLAHILAEGREKEAELTEQVDSAAVELGAKREELQDALDALADRLVEIYKGGDPDMATVLLEADGFDDLATRIEYLERIHDADADLAARVRALRDQVEFQLAQLEEAKARVAAFNEEIDTARAQMAAARSAAEAEVAAFAVARDRQADALATLHSQMDRWARQVQEAQQVSAAEAQQTVGDWFGNWAIPESIVMCESGGSFDAVNPSSGAGGAYQILPSTWEAYGGEGKPEDGSPQEQHEIAEQIWQDSGASAWVCAR